MKIQNRSKFAAFETVDIYHVVGLKIEISLKNWLYKKHAMKQDSLSLAAFNRTAETKQKRVIKSSQLL
jgi:hypothetical protein